ncbi:MAG: hypothetical protein Q8P24_12295 [Desulfobacterales bacterium]|nr:hypothetical protein [Desulfobacterales bacterium]
MSKGFDISDKYVENIILTPVFGGYTIFHLSWEILQIKLIRF